MKNGRKFEVLSKGIKGVTPPNSTCTTYVLYADHVYAESATQAEEHVKKLREGEIAQVFTELTKEIELTPEELAERVVGDE